MKRLFRFSLRGLAASTLLFGTLFAYTAHNYRTTRSANLALADSGAVGGIRVTGPEWLRRYVGDDMYFQEWVSFTVQKTYSLGDPHFTDDTLAGLVPHINQFSDLTKCSFLSVDITDDGIPSLSKLVRLKDLRIDSDLITDKGVRSLDALERLERLIIHCPNVTDKAIYELQSRKPNLRVMHFVKEQGKKTRLLEFDLSTTKVPPASSGG